MAFANSMLGFLILKLWFKHFGSGLFGLCFILSNYYILALFFTLERLKFGIIFILLAVLTLNNTRKVLLVIFSIFSHLSLVIVAFLSTLLIFVNRKQSLSKYIIKNFFLIFLLCALSLFSVNYFETQLLQKIPAYFLVENSREMLISGMKTAIFMVVSCLVVGKVSLPILVIYLPLITLSSILEPARMNFFAYLFFLYFCSINLYKIKTRIILNSTLLYYSISGFVYLNLLKISGG